MWNNPLVVQPTPETALMAGGILRITDDRLTPVTETDRLGQAQANHSPSECYQSADVPKDTAWNVFPKSTEQCPIHLSAVAHLLHPQNGFVYKHAIQGHYCQGIPMLNLSVNQRVR